MKRLILFIFIFISFEGISQKFSPPSINGCNLWLKADVSVNYDINKKVSIWSDNVGLHTASQLNSTNQPSFVVQNSIINNYSSIKFNNSFLSLGNVLPVDSIRTVFILLKQNLFLSYPMYLSKGFSSSGAFALGTNANSKFLRVYADGLISNSTFSVDTNWFILGCILEPSNKVSLLHNGNIIFNQPTSIDFSGTNSFEFHIGNNAEGNSYFFNGDIAEIIFYNRVLSEFERQQVEQYLRSKYAPPVNLGANINVTYGFCGITINAYKPWFTDYTWKKTGSQTTLSTNSALSVQQDGTYFVTVTDIFGYQSSDSINVQFPSLTLSCNDTTICLGDIINISCSLSSEPNYTYQWANGSAQNTYSSSSNENVFVIVKDTNNCKDTSNVIAITIDSLKNKVSFGADTLKICSGNTIYLASNPEPLSNLTFLWNDNSNDTLLTINTTGDYWVEVSNQRGCSGSDTVHVGITGTAPNINFLADTVCFGFSTTFTNQSSAADSVLWEFGDGNTSTQLNPVHLYSKSGVYAVKLTGYSGICSSFKQKNIIVKAVPQVDFSYSQSCINIPVEFNNLSDPNGSGIINSYYWNFGSEGSSSQENPVYTFAAGGSYNVSLTVISSNSCTNTVIKQIEIPVTALMPDISLIYPANNSLIADTSINFEWEGSNATKYVFQLSDTISFSYFLFSDTLEQNQITKHFNDNNNKTYYWKIKAYNFCNELIESPANKFTYFNPSSVIGNVLWLSADNSVTYDLNNKVSLWNDKLGYYYAIQNNSVYQPIFIDQNLAINNHSSIKFNNSFLSLGNVLPVDSIRTVFILLKQNLFLSYPMYLSKGFSSSGAFALGTNANSKFLRVYADGLISTSTFSVDTNWFILGCILEPSNKVSLLHNGNIVFNQPTSIDFSGSNSFEFHIGNNAEGNSYFFNGDIAEIIIYNQILSEFERQQVEQYLCSKYAPPVNLGPNIHVSYGFDSVTLDAGNRYTSYIWNTFATTQTIEVVRSGTYSVTVTDIFGRTSSDEIIVTYPEFYVPADTTICDGDTLQWSPDLRGPYFYLWNNGISTPSASFNQEGDYFVRITDTLGNSVVSDTLHLLVDLYPQTATLGPDSSMCAGNKLKLLSGASETALYQWDDGSVLPYLTVTSPGEYSVTVTNNRGCTAVDTINIDIHGIAPVAEFIADTACLNNPTHFTNLSLSPDGSLITQNIWNFGVNASSTLSNPEFVYPGPGEFEVILRILTQNNCAEEIIHTVKVYDNPKPRFSPQQGCTGTDIQFSSQSTSNNGSITSLTWIFNDSIFVVTNQPAFFYEQSGNYSIGLVAVSEFGCRDTLKKIINIRPGPFIGFENSPACIGEPVYFTGHAQTFLNTRAEFYWNVNGIAAAQISNPVFTFDTSASYLIQLTVVQPINNCSSHTEKVIQVYNKPVAAIASDQACQGEMVIISDTSVQGDNAITDFDYYIENKGYYHYRNPQVVFNDTGNYSILLTISDAAGCTDTAFQIFTVHPKPEPSFNFSPRLGVIPQQVQFINNSLHTETVVWDFGDGFVSNVYNPVHTYTDSGFFQINLTAYSEYGCINSSAATIKVLLPILEIEVRKVDVKFSGLYMEVSATLANFGTVEVNNMDLELQTSDGKLLKENWRGNFRSGGSFVYTFSTHLAYTELTKPQFICVTAIPYTLHDEVNTQNNMNCKTFSDGFTMYNMYPNPTSGDVNIEFNLPYETAVNIDFVNFMGETAYAFATPPLPKGFNRVIFDSRQLGLGLFICRVSFKDKQVSKRFWVTYGIR